MILLSVKKTIICLLLLICLVYPCTQIPDLIIINNDTLEMLSSPMKEFFPFYRKMPLKYKKISGNTACWRGYQALWELRSDSLFLREIYSCNSIPHYSITDSASFAYFGKIGVPKYVIDALKAMNGAEFSETKLIEIAGEKVLKKYGKAMASEFNWLGTGEKRILNKEYIVRKKYVRNKYFATNFSGKLKIPIGKLLFMDMGWRSAYEKYLILVISNGILAGRIEENDQRQYNRIH